MLLVLIGMILVAAVNVMDPSSGDTIKNTITIGYILTDVGMFAVTTFVLMAGILRKDLDKFIRAGLIIGASLILAAWLSFGISLLTIWRYF